MGVYSLYRVISYMCFVKSKCLKKSVGNIENFILCQSTVRLLIFIHCNSIRIHFGIVWSVKLRRIIIRIVIIHNKQSDFGCKWIFFKSSRTRNFLLFLNLQYCINDPSNIHSAMASFSENTIHILISHRKFEDEVSSTSVWIGSTKRHFVRIAIDKGISKIISYNN